MSLRTQVRKRLRPDPGYPRASIQLLAVSTTVGVGSWTRPQPGQLYRSGSFISMI